MGQLELEVTLGMGQLELEVTLGLISRHESSVRAFANSVGKTISEIEIMDNELLFLFSDGSKIKLFDGWQSCCEHRYMDTDDSLDDFVGSTLQGATVQAGPTDQKSSTRVDESAFLIVSTSKGQFTMVNYNEHNGNYGGFSIRAAEVES